MNWLNKLERKYRKLAIPGLIKYIVGITAAIYLMSMSQGSNLLSNMELIRSKVVSGEVWRLVTFIFIPQELNNPIFIIFGLYLAYIIGTALEHEWGSFKFNFYYLTGVVLTIIGAFITGEPTTATYISTSLFLAFAYIYPNYEFLMFFVLPVKVKYLGILTWGVYGYLVVTQPSSVRITIVASVINFLIYFSSDIIKSLNNKKRVTHNRQVIKVKRPSTDGGIHKCTICGRTEKDNSNLEFRYCSKCQGHHAYCSDHLFSHKHIT